MKVGTNYKKAEHNVSAIAMGKKKKQKGTQTTEKKGEKERNSSEAPRHVVYQKRKKTTGLCDIRPRGVAIRRERHT